MKKSITRIALSTVLISSALFAGKNVAPVESEVIPVVSVNPFYVGLGGVWALNSTKCPCRSGILKNNSIGVVGRIGYDFNQYFGIEGRALDAKWNKNYAETIHYGIYLKPQYHLTNALNVYGLLGYGHTKIIRTTSKVKNNYSKNGVAIGIGFEYDVSKDTPVIADRAFDGQGNQEKGLGIWVDYTNLLHNSGPKKTNANVLTAGVTYDF